MPDFKARLAFVQCLWPLLGLPTNLHEKWQLALTRRVQALAFSQSKSLVDVFFPPCHPSCNCVVVLERESSESWWISTLFLLAKIDGGAWNGFLRFSRKRTDLSKKKLHSLCILTKVYQSAKEERFWIFEPCHESAILVDFCMDSLLNRA